MCVCVCACVSACLLVSVPANVCACMCVYVLACWRACQWVRVHVCALACWQWQRGGAAGQSTQLVKLSSCRSAGIECAAASSERLVQTDEDAVVTDRRTHMRGPTPQATQAQEQVVVHREACTGRTHPHACRCSCSTQTWVAGHACSLHTRATTLVRELPSNVGPFSYTG